MPIQSTHHDCTWQLQICKWTRNVAGLLHRPEIHCCHRFPKRFLRSASMSSTSFSASFFLRSASCSKACTLCLTFSASSWGLAAGLELLHQANQNSCLCKKVSNQATQTWCRWPPTHQEYLCTFIDTNSISNPGWHKILADSTQITLSVMQKQHYLTCQS